MTVLTFPTNPTLGQQYAAPNGIQYVFDGVKWTVETVASSSAAVTNSVQDRVAPMFVTGDHTGIAFTYNAATNVISADVTAVNGDSLINGVRTLKLESNGNITAPSFTIPNAVGTSGQVLKWPSSGTTLAWGSDNNTTDRLVNGLKEVVLGADGNLTLPASGDINIPNGRANVTGTASTVGGGATVGVRSILAIDSAFGSNDANAPASAQAIRGRVTGSNLTKTRNYVAGVTGQYLVTGTNASEFINTGLLGVVGDQTTTANAAVVAYLDGDGGLTTAGSAYGVSMKNSTPGSGFDYGLDLQFIDLNVAGTTAPFKQADIRFNNGVELVANLANTISLDANLTVTGITLLAGGDIVDSNGDSVLGGGSGVDPNIWVQTFETASPATDVPQVAVGVEYDSAGNIIALFSHVNPVNDSTYYSVGKYTTTGTRIWTTRFDDEFYTDGWGLAVDNEGGFIYIAGETNADGGQNNATLTKINGTTGLVEWSKIYDFGYNSSSTVVDVNAEGDPVMVGFASNGDDRYVATTKVNKTTGAVTWSRALDGQNDEEAYGMAVGPSGEVVTVGYMESFGVQDAAETLSVDPVSDPQWTTSGSISADGVTADFTFTDGIPTFTNVVDTVGGRTADDVIVTVLGSTIGGVNGVDDMIVKVATVAANDTDDRMLVVKYAANGTIAWQKAIQFDDNFDCSGADADIDSQGNIYVCGQYGSDNVDPIGQLMSIVKFNSSGVKQWSRRVVGNCGQWTSSIVVGADDHLYLSGTTFSGTEANLDVHLVLAKYEFDGTVAWQRLLDYTAGYSFGTNFFGSDIGGSNLAVKQDYVAVSLGFAAEIFGGPGSINAAVAQISATGDIFTVGNWDFKTASFSGTVNSTASDITVVNAGKTDYDNIAGIDTGTVTLTVDSSNFLIGTLYTAPGGDNSLINGVYTVTLENDGTVTLPQGGTITEGYVTSNPTIQLTPASPDVASQKLVIKGGGSYNASDNGIGLNWYIINPLVGDTVEIYVTANAYANQTLYWWIYPEGAGIASPESGTVILNNVGSGDFVFTVDSDDYEFTVRVSPEANNYDPATGVETQLFNSSAPTLDADHHLHLTTGNLAETSIFLGTDDHNVRTTTAGNIEINTPGIVTVDGIVLQGTGYTNGSYTAQATTGGSGTGLTVDYLVNTNQVVTVTINQQGVGYNNGDVITIPGGSSSATVLLEVNANNVWAFGTDGSITFPTLTVPLEDNANPIGTGQVLKFSDSTQQAIIFGPVSTAGATSAERVIIQGAPGYTGTAGEGGDVYVWAGPGGSTNGQGGDIKVRAGRGNGTGTGGYLNFQAGDSATGNGGYVNIESGSSNTYGSGGDITIEARSGGEITLRTNNGSNSQNWLFGADGILTFPDGTTHSGDTVIAPGVYDIQSVGNTLIQTSAYASAKTWTFGTDGSLTLPGALVKSTVAKTGVILPTTTGIPNALSGTMVGLGIADGTYGPFTKGGVTFSVTVAGGGISGFINISSTTSYAVNATIGQLTSEDLGDPPGQTTNIGVDSVVQETPTAVDLTKSVNKLTNGSYTLANGVEGQIMYLVRQTGSTAHNVIVASARVDGAIETNISFTPFAPVQEVPTNMATLIFTDSAWQSMGGFWNFT